MAVESKLRFDKDLTRLSIAYKPEFDKAVLEVAPFVKTPRSFSYPSYGKGAFEGPADPDEFIRAIGDPTVKQVELPGATWNEIFLPEYTLKAFVEGEGQSGIVEGLVATSAQEAAELIKQKLYEGLQKKVISDVLGITNTATPATKWDDANGDPIKDINTAITAFKGNCGAPPTHILIPDIVVPTLASKIRSGYGITTEADYFKILQIHFTGIGIPPDNIVIGTAQEYSGGTYTSAWGDNVLLFRKTEKPQRWTRDFMKTFVQKETTDVLMDRYPHSDKIGEYVRGYWRYAVKITMEDAGYLIKDVLT